MLRLVRFLALLLLLLIGGTWAYAWITKAPAEGLGEAFVNRLTVLFGGQQSQQAVGRLQLPQGMVLGGPFSLTDQTGKPVTDRDYAGKWMLVYFGYTYCPDVCPTELGTMAAAIDELGPQGDKVVPVFITVDPQRDTPAQLADYVSRFHPRLQGLTGTPEQVAEVARHYRVFYAKVQRPEATEYLMDHSSFVYLVGPDGRVRSLFRPEAGPEDIAATTRAQLSRDGAPAS
jgi:cytochrome oxidase Cu insertion factor (SCO1/SenC/PrrC family)